MSVDAGTIFLLLGVGLFAGAIGALVGIGGGIIVVPSLVVGLGFDIKTAVAASLIAVVATSVAAGIAYAEHGMTNVRLGLALEVATTVGGVVGGLIGVSIAPSVTSGIFSAVMIVVAVLMWRHVDQPSRMPAEFVAAKATEEPGMLSGGYFDQSIDRQVSYEPRRLGIGASLSSIAGVLSGLLGVGGGFLKVPVMSIVMSMPTKAAAATSNFMVGITAVASLVIYLARGFVEPMVAVPVSIGIVIGALAASRMSRRVPGVGVQRVLAVILVIVAGQMAWEAIGGAGG